MAGLSSKEIGIQLNISPRTSVTAPPTCSCCAIYFCTAVSADPLYQHLIVTAERKFWRCVESGEPPTLFGIEPPKPRIAAVRIVDMSASNAWAQFAGALTRTHPAFLEHERAKAELKGLVPGDAQQAIGHGVRAKRSKSGAITLELLNADDGHAAV